jgi:hypothetical protein
MVLDSITSEDIDDLLILPDEPFVELLYSLGKQRIHSCVPAILALAEAQ